MKIKRAFIAFIAILIIFMNGCHKDNPTNDADNQRAFMINDNALSNGTLTYIRLPKCWYYDGDFPYRFGVVQGGRTLYSADESGTIIKEKKPLLADMDYAPWIRDDTILPDLYGEEITVTIYFMDKDSFHLTGQAKDEFIEWFGGYQSGNNKAMIYIPQEQPIGYIVFESTEIPGLYYDCDLLLVQLSSEIVIVDNSNMPIASFDQGTDLFRMVGTQGDGSLVLTD